MAGQVDQPLFLTAIHNPLFDAKRFAELLGSVSQDFLGNLNRASNFAVIRQGRPQIVASIRLTEGGTAGLPDGRLVRLDSAEFRREIRREIRGGLAGERWPAKARQN